MPYYDNQCKACGHRFETFQKMTDKPVRKCPKCGRQKAARLISGGVGIIFKGSGWTPKSSGCASCTSGNCASCGHH